MKIDRVATMANYVDGTQQYHYRNDADIVRTIHYALEGNKDQRPFYSFARAFNVDHNDPDEVSRMIIENQAVHNKTKGIRIRHELVEVSKDELDNDSHREQIICIADKYSDYYQYAGFRVAYGVFDCGDYYRIDYVIDPVNYHDGSKYRYNQQEILAQEQEQLKTVVSAIREGTEDQVDLQHLQYYPFY